MTQAGKVDGRRVRSLRTRNAILDALMDLVEDGILAPTAQQIATRAGVSIRSVYQHFTDAEGLFSEALVRILARTRELAVVIDPTWPLARRIEVLVDERGAVFEMITPFSRAALGLEAQHPAIEDGRRRLSNLALEEVGHVFGPELGQLDEPHRGELLRALDASSAWMTWNHLRFGGCSVEQAKRVVRRSLSLLLSGPGVAPVP